MKWIYLVLLVVLTGCSLEEEDIIKKKSRSSSISSFNSGQDDNSNEKVNWMIFEGKSDDNPDLIFAEFAIKDSLMIGNYFFSGQNNLVNLEGKIDSLGRFYLTQLFKGDSIGYFHGNFTDSTFTQLSAQQTEMDSIVKNISFNRFSLRDSSNRIFPEFLIFQRKSNLEAENNEKINFTQFGERDFTIHFSSIDSLGNTDYRIEKGFFQNENFGIILSNTPNTVRSIALYEDSIIVSEDQTVETSSEREFIGTFEKVK